MGQDETAAKAAQDSDQAVGPKLASLVASLSPQLLARANAYLAGWTAQQRITGGKQFQRARAFTHTHAVSMYMECDALL